MGERLEAMFDIGIRWRDHGNKVINSERGDKIISLSFHLIPISNKA
jgi:hypothetical protein